MNASRTSAEVDVPSAVDLLTVHEGSVLRYAFRLYRIREHFAHFFGSNRSTCGTADGVGREEDVAATAFDEPLRKVVSAVSAVKGAAAGVFGVF